VGFSPISEMSLHTPDVDFIRVASAAPELRIADIRFNAAQIRAAMEQAAERAASIVLFPELSLTAYTCGDLFRQATLLSEASEALLALALDTERIPVLAIVGLPLNVSGRLYNCAAVIGGGTVLGIVPKMFLPTTG
jgi:NAD+ synthase (glutamine-hydrolysing)